jgi:PBP1b-binding outer membrane lipoprotein LpoB
MTKDMLDKPWYYQYREKQQRPPVVIVGTIRNLSDEHIETLAFVNDIERELINSGMVKFVASKQEREEVREEKLDQQTNASEDTYKKLRIETGADFMMQGSIVTIIDAVDNVKAKYYQTDMQLINLETMEKVWIGTKKIKKIVTRNSLGG